MFSLLSGNYLLCNNTSDSPKYSCAVTVTNHTHSNETKVKIISLIVSDVAGPTGD